MQTHKTQKRKSIKSAVRYFQKLIEKTGRFRPGMIAYGKKEPDMQIDCAFWLPNDSGEVSFYSRGKVKDVIAQNHAYCVAIAMECVYKAQSSIIIFALTNTAQYGGPAARVEVGRVVNFGHNVKVPDWEELSGATADQFSNALPQFRDILELLGEQHRNDYGR